MLVVWKADGRVTFLTISASIFTLQKQPWLPVSYVSFQKYSNYIFIYIVFLLQTITLYTRFYASFLPILGMEA